MVHKKQFLLFSYGIKKKLLFFVLIAGLFGIIIFSSVWAQTGDVPPRAPSQVNGVVVPPASVLLSWRDNSDNETGFVVHRSLSSLFLNETIFIVGINKTQYSDNTVVPGTEYFYRVDACIATACSQSNSVKVFVPSSSDQVPARENSSPSKVTLGTPNTSLLEKDFDLYGIGWSAQDNKGIGWVVLNSENPSSQPKGTPPVSFKVSVKNKTTLEGQGWASIRKGNVDSYGWLSFNKSDLTDCPEKNTNSQNCKATLEYASGTISGWAKFICVAGGCGAGSGSEVGSWDGWVSLRNTKDNVKYGLCLGRRGTQSHISGTDLFITGETCDWDGVINNNQVEVNGAAWGGASIGGWILFGYTAPPSAFGLTPNIHPSLFPREQLDFSVEKSATWFVNNNPGGDINTVGSISPKDTAPKAQTIYQAPNSGGPFIIKASSTASGEVASTTATVKFPYVITCEPSGTSTMVLQWRWSKSPVDSGHGGGYLSYAAHNISITRIPDSGGTKLIVNKPGGAPESFSDTGLSTSTKYTYKLDVGYTSFVYATSTEVKDCSIPTSIPTVETPSKLKTFATDDKTIYINWKDNTTTTKPYRFNLERIKLTPASSTDIKIDSSKSVTSKDIYLVWKNNTTSTPYINWIERSTSTSHRFLKNLPPNDVNNDKAMVIDKTFPGSNSPSDGLKSYTYSSTGLQEATTYYYRVKACSTYGEGSLNEAYKNDRISGETNKPIPVCGKYAPSPEGTMLVGGGGTNSVTTTTLPNTPSHATSTAFYNNGHSIVVKWIDESKRETAYEIWRVDGNSGSERIIKTISTGPTGSNATSSMTYTDAWNLVSGTSYTYEIRAYYDIPTENGGGKVYSNWTTTNTHTYYYVTVTVQNYGEGTVYGPGNLNNCTTTCKDYFSWDSVPQVKLTASPNNDTKFTGWDGVSCKEGNTSEACTFDRGNHNITANFEKTIFTVTMSMNTINATGTVKSAPAGINCTCGSSGTCGVNGASACNASFPAGTTVTLTATTTYSNVKFVRWGGNCAGTNPKCILQLSNDMFVTADFDPIISAEGTHKDSFFADLWSNAKYMWRGLFVDHSQERVSALSASFSNIVKGVQDGWNTITVLFSEMMKQAEEAATKLAQNTAKVAEGQSTGDPLDVYFKSIATTTMPSYIDKNLEPDTVYLYRVKLIYDESPIRVVAPPSNSGATKTFSDTGGGVISNKGVCTRNSFCDFSVKSYNSSINSNRDPKVENTEQQCTKNVECKNVGRYGQAFQER